MAAVATHLADTSALARLRHPAVAALIPLIDAGVVATCGVVEFELGWATRSSPEFGQLRADRDLGYERVVSNRANHTTYRWQDQTFGPLLRRELEAGREVGPVVLLTPAGAGRAQQENTATHEGASAPGGTARDGDLRRWIPVDVLPADGIRQQVNLITSSHGVCGIYDRKPRPAAWAATDPCFTCHSAAWNLTGAERTAPGLGLRCRGAWQG